MTIYLDNSATSFPKPKQVGKAITDLLTKTGGSFGRSQSAQTHSLERTIYDTRKDIANFFNFKHPDHVVFTKNITESINLLLYGFLNAGDHVVISSLEHNATVRPLEGLCQTRGITYEVVPCNNEGIIDYLALERALKKIPKLLMVNHASNVSGDVQDITLIGELAKRYGVAYFVDAAQTAGVIPVDMQKSNIDVLGFTGHKALLGPQGIGGLLIHPNLAQKTNPFIMGGTGSRSEEINQPTLMPDKFESGTINGVGIVGLKAGMDYLKTLDLEDVHLRECQLIGILQRHLERLPNVRIIGNKDPYKRVGILSVDFMDKDNALIAHALSKNYGITTRVGLHCSPLAHKTYDTYPKGTVRFSTSLFNTEKDMETTVYALLDLL